MFLYTLQTEIVIFDTVHTNNKEGRIQKILENNSRKPTLKQIKLLKALISDQKNAPDIYKPSPHWWRRSLSAAREI